MAHNLTVRRDGAVEMAYIQGLSPWHGLGNSVEKGTSIDGWIKAAGMDWSVGSSKVHYQFGNEDFIVDDRIVLHRGDTGAALGVVSSSYKIVQPRETLEFFQDLVESVGLEMVSAGTLFGGRRFWATALIGEEALLDSRDVVKGYLLISTSADGSLATTVRHTSVCVVCDNTLRMAHSSEGAKVRTVHSAQFDPEAAKKTLGAAPRTFSSFMEVARRLASAPMTEVQALELTQDLVESEGKTSARIMELFRGAAQGSELDGRRETAWAWLNAVTEWGNHEKRGKSESHKLNSALFGSGDRLMVRGLEAAMEFAGIEELEDA